MQLKRFQASTIAEAYERVREAMGDDAVIVSTRTATVPGLLGRAPAKFVEIVAGIPDDLAEQAAYADPGYEDERELAPPFVNDFAGSFDSPPFEDEGLPTGDPHPLSARPELVEGPRGERGQESRGLGAISDVSEIDALPEPRSELLSAIMQDLSAVRGMVERISAERANALVDAGPKTLREARARLAEQGVSANVTQRLLDPLIGNTKAQATSAQVLHQLAQSIESQLSPVVTIRPTQGALAIFVVGPSGSGKTSAAVRLAQELAERRGARVVLAGIDVTRAGAPQALTACGAAADVPVELCYTPAELKALIEGGTADVVVVDTPGHNGMRRDRMTELGAYMQATPRRLTLLALPASMKTDDVLRLSTAFGPVGVTGLVGTRCDETSSYGGLLSAAIESGIGIAYTTHAEGITQGLRGGDNRALAAAVISGQWPEPVVAQRVARAG